MKELIEDPRKDAINKIKWFLFYIAFYILNNYTF